MRRRPICRAGAAWSSACKKPEGEVKIAVVGKYMQVKDSYKSLIEALTHGGLANNVRVHMDWIDSEVFEREDAAVFLEDMHGILVPGGFGERGTEGKIEAVKFAREREVPFFGICYGLHMAVIEAARDLAGLEGAGSTEISKPRHPVIALMTEWTKGNLKETRNEAADLGGTMRLGAYPAVLKPGSRVAEVYGTNEISERHRHRYEVNVGYTRQLGRARTGGFRLVAGRAAAGDHGNPRPSVVHRRAVPSRTEIQTLRAAPIVCVVRQRRGAPEQVGVDCEERTAALNCRFNRPAERNGTLLSACRPGRLRGRTRFELRDGFDFDQLYSELMSRLPPPELSGNDDFKHALGELNVVLFASMAASLRKAISILERGKSVTLVVDDGHGATERRDQEVVHVPMGKFKQALAKFQTQFDLSNSTFDAPSIPSIEGVAGEQDQDIVAAVVGLKLIDVSNVSWEQILEFRQDKAAQDKLRRSRLFAFENYVGRSRSFVEDDILCRLDDYHAQVKKWGFETIIGAVKSTLNSKLLGGSLAGSLIASLAGAQASAMLAAGTGVAVEFGKIAIEITRQRLAMREFTRTSPFSYFEYASKKIGPARKKKS